MKNVIYSLVVLLSLITFSCENSFQPKADFTERYVLNCVINSDSLVQYASLSHSYDVEGFDPYTNTNDPYIKNAEVYIKHNGITYQMRDTALTRTDTSRYSGPLNVYTTSSFLAESNDSIEIIAKPKEGVTLRAKTKVPAKVYVYANGSTILDVNTDMTFTWSSRDLDIMFLPRLKVRYVLRNEVPAKVHLTEVPIFIDQYGKSNFPHITKTGSVFYAGDIIDKTLLNISGDNDKGNYKFLNLEMEVKVFDPFLSAYISSTNLFYEDISIRLDEPNYTNVEGGYGIVGSTTKVYKTIGLSDDYLLLLGYTQ